MQDLIVVDHVHDCDVPGYGHRSLLIQLWLCWAELWGHQTP